MLAKRCCGRDAILAVVRRAADDMAESHNVKLLLCEDAEKEDSSESNNGCHMAACFRGRDVEAE